MQIRYLPVFILLLTACAGDPMRGITFSDDPNRMSAQTLCYKYAVMPHHEAFATEVAVRDLDCAAILDDDPLYQGR